MAGDPPGPTAAERPHDWPPSRLARTYTRLESAPTAPAQATATVRVPASADTLTSEIV